MTAYMICQIDRYRQRETQVTILCRVPYERHYYRVRLPTGEVTVVNDSMLRFA